MTSFAFILGCTPLLFALGAGAGSRRILGTTVVGGMLAASALVFSSSRSVLLHRIIFQEKETKPAAKPKEPQPECAD